MLMIRNFKTLLITLLLVISSAAGVWAQVTAVAPAVGDGSAGAPYEISTPAEFKWFFKEGITANPGACAILTQDIDLAEVCYFNNSWIPAEGIQYSGTFDGQNHVIDNFYSYRSSDNIGLFRHLNGATVRNVKFDHVTISNANWYAGTVAAWAEGATIQNVHILKGGTIDGQMWIGGLVGQGYCHVADCSNYAYVRANMGNGGGIVGGDWSGHTSSDVPDKQLIIERCVNGGRVVANTRFDSGVTIGGIVGSLSCGEVSNCVALPVDGPTGNWSGVTGGIVGSVSLVVGCPVTIEHCLNLNNVGAFYNYGDGTGQILGSVMYNGASGVTLPTVTIRDCYWSSEATLRNNSVDKTNRISSHAYSELTRIAGHDYVTSCSSGAVIF